MLILCNRAVLFGVANVIFNAIHFSTTDQMWYALYVAIFKYVPRASSHATPY